MTNGSAYLKAMGMTEMTPTPHPAISAAETAKNAACQLYELALDNADTWRGKAHDHLMAVYDRINADRDALQSQAVEIERLKAERDEARSAHEGLGFDCERLRQENVRLKAAISMLAPQVPDGCAWRDIASAPHDKRIIVYTEKDIYAVNWVKNPETGHEAWLVCAADDGTQMVIGTGLILGWTDAPSVTEPGEK